MTEVLKRRLGLGLLTAYGVGVMVGAGIYVLVGAVVGQAGLWAPLAFLLAGLVALPSALVYAELATRMPEAAGEVAFIERGFASTALGLVAGLAIVLAGTISGAAVLRGGAGYLGALVPVPEPWLIVALGLVLVIVAAVGVLESMVFAAVLTVIEVGGLLAVCAVGLAAGPAADWTAPAAPDWPGVAAAISLCFFAFIGFDNIENMAEEVRDPTRTLPRAILLALAVTAVLYGLVSLAAVRAVPHAALAASERPLALLWETATGRSAAFLSAIAVFAAVNGVLAQIVMAARVLFGLGRRAGWLGAFHHAHPRFGTPVLATLLVGTALIGAALALPVAALAEATAVVLLAVFVLVNIAAIRIKRRAPAAPFRVPGFVPWAGLVAAALALVAAGGAFG
ncbi:MAG: amino acid permease [Rhodobacteraceae bacterium]|nr:amino acid permease [Paracoccaceae bacterium]MCC0046544.1 amino acid permease [Defluviimonas sp.]MCB2140011.1 amino acid permease [Paracoccaceae bacterium]MCB2142021.1 amino acid permease [Paracoccaceae bacterium]MCB2158769.1 amino acid permease [Paracoccaceae bacterium]